jgi:hypothetical protein
LDLRPGRGGQKFCTAGRSGRVRFAYGDNTAAPDHREFGANSTASPRESARISSHHETWIVRDRRHTQHKISARFAAIDASIWASFRPVRESSRSSPASRWRSRPPPARFASEDRRSGPQPGSGGRDVDPRSSGENPVTPAPPGHLPGTSKPGTEGRTRRLPANLCADRHMHDRRSRRRGMPYEHDPLTVRRMLCGLVSPSLPPP